MVRKARERTSHSWKLFSLVFILLLSSAIVLAQGGRMPSSGPPPPIDVDPDVRNMAPEDRDRISSDSLNKRRVVPTQTAENDTCLLPPLNLTGSSSIPADQLQSAAKSKKEYQKACSSLEKKRMAEAEKHLRKAVSQAPKYAVAWVTLGQVLTAEQKIDEAERACAQASNANSAYVPSYLCLADIAAQEHEWDVVLKWSQRAIELDPNSVVAYEYHAAANLNLHELPTAEKSARHAADIDKDHREPRVYFVLAQIYEAKGDRASEAAQLEEYLKYAVNSADILIAKAALVELKKNPNKGDHREPSLGTNLSAVAEALPVRWGPPEIDEQVPPVLTDANCALPQILREASDRTQDLIDSLQSFSANERIQQTDTDKKGKKRSETAQDSNYVVQIGQNSYGYPKVEEYRSGMAGSQRAGIMDSGTAAFALIFHPTHIENFTFRCEGLTALRGASAWQVHFEESADPNKSFIAIRAGGTSYLPRFKGRAWIAADTYNVLRIETDLVSPIPQIDLQLEHMVIDYAPVEFEKRHAELWLPQSTSLYMGYRGHRYEIMHNFSAFQLFSVDAQDAIKDPETPQKWQLGAMQETKVEIVRQLTKNLDAAVH
jgi:tetratricopeptide (TPR) repeat protein